jgi:hypothetical protein
MKDLKQTSFSDRQTAAAEARKAMLAKFKPKPSVTAPEGVVSRAEVRAAELEQVREQRLLEREIAREARAKADEARRIAEEEAARLAQASKRESIKERKQREKAEALARRQAQFAALRRY